MLEIKVTTVSGMYSVTTKGSQLTRSSSVVILLHGRRQTIEDMSEVIQRLDLDDFTYVLPIAPEATWYPRGFTRNIEDNQPCLREGLDYIHSIFQCLISQGIESKNIFLAGFSQGACVVAEFMKMFSYRVGGVILFTGGLFGPECPTVTTPKDIFGGMKMYLTGSHNDSWVSSERVVQTATYFERLGADVNVNIFMSRGHYISTSEIEIARELLSSRFVKNGGEKVYE